MTNVKVITDSSCDLPVEIRDKAGITVVPLFIRFDDEEFIDGVNLSTEDFWRRTKEASVLPATAAPAPGAFAEAFQNAHAEGHSSVLCITLASKLSGTYQSAVTAAAMVKDEIEVRVLDSETVTVALGSLCLEASERASTGASLDEVVGAVVALQKRQHIFGTLDTLENLRKGGRIGAAGAFFASILSVKPTISIEGGEVKPKAKNRTRSKALAHLAKLVTEQGPIDHVGVSHGDAEDVDEFLELLRPVVSPSDVLLAQIGPVIGTHGGPRLMAVSFAVSDD